MGVGVDEEEEEESFPHGFSYAINWFGLWCLMPLLEFELTNLVVIGTDCTCSCKSKSNYHTIMTTTAPLCHWVSIISTIILTNIIQFNEYKA